MSERDKLIHWLEYEKPAYESWFGPIGAYFSTMCGNEYPVDDEAHTFSGKLAEVDCADCHARRAPAPPNKG